MFENYDADSAADSAVDAVVDAAAAVPAPAVLGPIDDFLDAYVMEQTYIRSVTLVEKSSLPLDQWEDIQQDMLIALLKAKRRFDPTKAGSHTFASRVMDGFCKDFIRRLVHKRQNGMLDVPCADLGDEFSMDEYPVGKSVLDDVARDEIIQAVRRVVKGLPPRLRKVCDLIMQGGNCRSIFKKLKISHQCYYRRMEELRWRFRAAGLSPEKIFQKQGDTF